MICNIRAHGTSRATPYPDTADTKVRRSAKPQPRKTKTMLSWTLTFLIIAIIAGVLGFTGLMGTMAWLAQVCFVLFLILFVFGLLTGHKPKI